MHDGLTFTNWFVVATYTLMAVLLAGAAAVIVSSLRRPSGDFGRLGRYPWLLVQAVFVIACVFAIAASALGFGKSVPAAFAGVLGVFVVIAAAQQIAYLLRVVFPSPARLEARSASESRVPDAAFVLDPSGPKE